MKKVVLLLSALCIAAYAQKKTVAILPSDGVLNQEQTEALTDRMHRAVMNVVPEASFTILRQEVVIKRLGRAESYIRECIEGTCIVDMGRKAQADYVAKASVWKLGNKLRMKIELYDVETEGSIGFFDEDYKDFESLRKAINEHVPDMFRRIPGVAAPAIAAENVYSGVFTDSRDGKKYRVAKIGSQVWMAENLNYNASGSKCYENRQDNCAKYGRLYSWNTARNACPQGWHLPAKEEWEIMTDYIGGAGAEGKKLKAKSGWNLYNGTDAYGFTALPSGAGFWEGDFGGIGKTGFWWSASWYDADYAYYRGMYSFGDVADWSPSYKGVFQGVRCLRN